MAYYRSGSEPILTDAEYDLLRPALKNLAPNDERIDRVGIPFDLADLRNKVEHRIPMGSLDNTDDGIAGYAPWLSQVATPTTRVFASLKVDGGSICATYKEGKLVRVATRGNGAVGQDITVNGINFKNLPLELNEPLTMDVRGEAVMYIEEYKAVRSRDAGMPFDKIPKESQSNPRNVGNGVFSRDDGVDSEKMTFISFNVDVIGPTFANTEEQKMKFLKSMGFLPVPHIMCDTVEQLKSFYDSTVAGRDDLPFEIDGLVVVLDDLELQSEFITDDVKTKLRPKYARAIKFPHKSNTTILESVAISVGHTGGIIPTARLQEVRIGGVNVSNCLLNNWDEIGRLGVQLGDEVEVILAGDIIPKIIRVVNKGTNRTPIEEPKTCPSCSKPTTRIYRGKEGAVVYCTDPQNCPDCKLGKIDKWIGSSKKGVGILNIGDGILKAMWDNEVIGDAADLYTLKPDDLKDLELEGGGRIGESRANKIVANIQGKKHLPLEVFLGSLGIDLLGRRRVIILRENANGELDTLADWLDFKKLGEIKMEGFGDAIREAVINGMKEMSLLINKLMSNGVTISYPIVSEDGDDADKPFSGLIFCITGTRAFMADVEERGGVFASSVPKSKKSVHFLIQKDPLQMTTKAKNADANGFTQIISLDFLKKVLDGQAELPALVEA